MHVTYFNVGTAKLNEAETQRIAGHSAISGPQQQPFRNCVRESRLPKTFSQLVPHSHLRLAEKARHASRLMSQVLSGVTVAMQRERACMAQKRLPLRNPLNSAVLIWALYQEPLA